MTPEFVFSEEENCEGETGEPMKILNLTSVRLMAF
jgi:hypothetical protein